MEGLGSPLGNDFYRRGTHIGDHKAKVGTLGAKPVEEPLKGSDGPLLAIPQKGFAVLIDLVDERNV